MAELLVATGSGADSGVAGGGSAFSFSLSSVFFVLLYFFFFFFCVLPSFSFPFLFSLFLSVSSLLFSSFSLGFLLSLSLPSLLFPLSPVFLFLFLLFVVPPLFIEPVSVAFHCGARERVTRRLVGHWARQQGAAPLISAGCAAGFWEQPAIIGVGL